MSTNMYAVYEAMVRKFDTATKIATVVMPGVYGMEPIEAPPFTRQGMNPVYIESLVVGDRVLVVQGENEVPEWLSTNPDWFRAGDTRYDARYVNLTGDEMSGKLIIATNISEMLKLMATGPDQYAYIGFYDELGTRHGWVGKLGPGGGPMYLVGDGAYDLNLLAGGTLRLDAGGVHGVTMDDSTITVGGTHTMNFSSATRQMLNLYGTSYGAGVQGGTLYLRTSSVFNIYRGGVHSDTAGAPGAGGVNVFSIRGDGVIEGFTRIQGPMRPQTGMQLWGNGGSIIQLYDGATDADTLGTRTGFIGFGGASPNNHLFIYNENGADTRILSGSGPIIFFATTTEIARMTTTTMLVGKSSSTLASEGVELYGTAVGAIWCTRVSSNGSNYISNKAGATANIDGAVHFEVMQAGTQIGRIVRSTVTAAAYLTNSDGELKQNFEPVDDELALMWMRQLEPMFFNFKENPEVTHVGYAAQDMAAVWPNSVTNGIVDPGHGDINARTWDDEGNETTPREVWTSWMMDHGKLTPFLHSALQAIDRIVMAQADRIDALEAKVAELESSPSN